MLSGDNLTIALFFIGTAISIALTAMSAAGWRHPVLIGGLFGLAFLCFLVGLAWPELKTVSPAITATVNQIATSPVAWFMVFMIGIGAALLLPKRSGGGTIARAPVMASVAVPAPAPATTPASAPTPQRKVFVNVSPSYLIDLYKDKTTVQGDASAAVYIGKWIETTFKVYDVSESVYAILVQSVISSEIPNQKHLSAQFSKESSEHVSLIAKDTTITVRGEINSITNMRVTLQKCELVETGPS